MLDYGVAHLAARFSMFGCVQEGYAKEEGKRVLFNTGGARLGIMTADTAEKHL